MELGWGGRSKLFIPFSIWLSRAFWIPCWRCEVSLSKENTQLYLFPETDEPPESASYRLGSATEKKHHGLRNVKALLSCWSAASTQSAVRFTVLFS